MKLAKGIVIILLLFAGAYVLFRVVPDTVADRMNRIVIPPPYSASKQAEQLHRDLFIADLHADSLLWNRDLLNYGTYGHVDVPRLLQGNVGLQAFTVVTKVPRGRRIAGGTSSSNLDLITMLSIVQLWPVSTWMSLKERALYQAKRLHETETESEGKLVLIKSSHELEEYVEKRTSSRDMVGAFLGIEGSQCLEGEVGNVDVLFDAGFRMMSPTHHFDTEMGGSAHGESGGGLTEFGKQVIQRMESLNMIVDLSHASPALIDDVLDSTTLPIVVSHTGVKGTCDNQRNVSDHHLRRIAEAGGLIGIGYWSTAVCGTDVESIARAIRYTADLVGIDHLALGSDFDGSVRAIVDTTGIVLITDALLAHGFSEEEIRKIMGANVLRFLRDSLPGE